MGGVSLEVGALVVMPAEEDAEQPALGLLQAMWKPSSGPAEMQVSIPHPLAGSHVSLVGQEVPLKRLDCCSRMGS